MGTLQRLSKSSLKVLLCLILIFTCVFVQPKEKMENAQAVVPIIIGILASVVLDIAVDAGFKFADKAIAKSKSKNIATKIYNKYSDEFKKFKPTKKNIGKLVLELPGYIIAEIIDELGDEAEIAMDKGGKGDYEPPKIEDKYEFEGGSDGSDDKDPLYNTKINVVLDKEKAASDGMMFYAKYGGNVKITPNSFKKQSIVNLCIGTDCSWDIAVPGGRTLVFYPNTISSDEGLQFNYHQKLPTGENVGHNWVRYFGKQHIPSWKDFIKNLETGGKSEYEFDGLTVNKDHDTYIRLDDDDKELTPEQMKKIDFSKLPGKYKDTEFDFDFDFSNYPTVKDGDEFEWELVENDIQQKIDNDTIYNDYDFNYSPTINNYYQMSDSQKIELEQQIDIIINIIVPPGDGDGGGNGDGGGYHCVKDGQIVPCKDVEKIDGSLLAYVRNAYEYATGFVKTAVDGLKSLGTGAVELTKLYGVFFGWLPKEIVVLMSSGLAIMLGLRIFRK